MSESPNFDGLRPGGLLNINTPVAYPSSLTYRWPHDEGSGTTVADAEANANDITLSGTYAWVTSGNYVGSNAVDYTDGEGSLSVMSELLPSNAHSFAFTIDPDDLSANQGVFEQQDVSDNRTVVYIDSNNRLRIAIYDGNWSAWEVDTNDMTDTLSRWCYTYDGSSPTWYLNGSSVTTNSVADDGFSGINNGNATFGDKVSGGSPFAGVIDNPAVYDVLLTSSEVNDDYLKQPFS